MEEKAAEKGKGARKSPRHHLSWPPCSYKKWLELTKTDEEDKGRDGPLVEESSEWPYHSQELDTLIPTTDDQSDTMHHLGNTLLGSLDDIKEDLKQHAPYDTKVLDGIDERLQRIEGTLQKCSSWFLDPNPKLERPQKTFLTDLNEELLGSRRLRAEQSELQKLDHDPLEDRGSRTVDSLRFPGLHKAGRCVLLPGKLEALYILNLVTKCANIPTCIMKSWKTVFFCNTSTSILQNTFWWMWMDRFKPSPRWQAHLFDHIADDFALLLNQMTGNHADTTFMLYPVYLSQALYSCFCQAFPGSSEQVNDPEFLEYISNTTSEWIKGVRSVPEAWKVWPRNMLAPSSARMLSERDGPVVPNGGILNSPYCSPQKTVSILGSATSKSSYKNISLTDITVESGPTFERVQFKTLGQSPLLAHSLRNQHTKANAVISRTQVKELPPPGTSYKEVLQCYTQKSDDLFQEYDSTMADYEHSIAADRKKLLRKLRKMDLKKEQLLQNRHEVAQMAFDIAASRDQP